MKDRLSALLDGDLDEQAAHPDFESMRRDSSLHTDWEAYCLIGDVLRGDRDGNAGFVGRVMANIDEEPTLLAPSPRPAAEDGRLWRSLMPLAASVMFDHPTTMLLLLMPWASALPPPSEPTSVSVPQSMYQPVGWPAGFSSKPATLRLLLRCQPRLFRELVMAPKSLTTYLMEVSQSDQ